MSLRRPIVAGALIVGASLVTVVADWAAAQPESETPQAAGEPAPPTEVADVPGPAHARLAALAGDWTSLSIVRAPDGSSVADDPADSEPGAVRIESILDARFISIHESGSMMGEAFDSVKIVGFNNAAGLYEATWIYTGSTAMMRMRGTSEDDGRIISFQAQYAASPDGNERFLVTVSIRSHDEFVISLVALLPDGSAGPALETTYSRVK